MRGLWLLLAGCATDREPPPPIPDGIYKVASAPLPSDDAGVRDASVFFVKGTPYNQMSKALMALSSAELYPTATIDGVELALSDDVLTVVHRGVMDTPTPLQYEDGVVTAGGATIDATVAIPGADPVRVDLIDATVRLDPTTLRGAIGGIVPTAQKIDRLYPIVVTALNKQVEKDCKRLDDPTHHCGCRDGSNGFQILDIMTEGTFHCVLTAYDLVDAGLPASYVADDMPTGFTFGLGITTERE